MLRVDLEATLKGGLMLWFIAWVLGVGFARDAVGSWFVFLVLAMIAVSMAGGWIFDTAEESIMRRRQARLRAEDGKIRTED